MTKRNRMSDLLCQLACWCKDQGLALLQRHIKFLENGNGKRGRFAGAWLSLCNHIVALDAGYDCTLLDCRRLLETIGVDSTQQVFLQAHVIKVVHHLIPVALQSNITHLCQSFDKPEQSTPNSPHTRTHRGLTDILLVYPSLPVDHWLYICMQPPSIDQNISHL